VAVHVVRLGTPRRPDEGPRLGTVRRPPRGVRKEELAARDFYDVWFPNLAPSADLVKQAQHSESEAEWRAFERAYRKEMAAPDAARTLDVLATLSHTADFAVGCYCADEARCHRSVLRALLAERAATIA
jgi:uncharacterized protein YeaO (DUF488 family)